jgi:hypothetical protein
MVAELAGESGALGVRVGPVAARTLRAEQQRALEMLVAGTCVAETARTVGVDRTTIYHWLRKDAVFVAAYNEWRETLKASCQARLMAMAERAAGAVERALEAGDAKLGWAVLKEMKLMSGPPAVPSESTDPEVVRREMAIEERFRGKVLVMEEEKSKGGVAGLLEVGKGSGVRRGSGG